MLSHIANLMLVLTAFAPVLVTYAFVSYRHGGNPTLVLILLSAAILLTIACWRVIRYAESELPEFGPFHATTIKPVDSELLTYVLAYLLPLVNVNTVTIDWWVLLFIIGFLILIAWGTHAYYFNPLLSVLFKYHFYEVSGANGMTYILLSNRNLRGVHQVTKVKQLGAHVLMDTGESE